jgi:hypothetical protein
VVGSGEDAEVRLVGEERVDADPEVVSCSSMARPWSEAAFVVRYSAGRK